MMPHALALAVEIVTTVLTVAGILYFLLAMVAARVFLGLRRRKLPDFAPGVSILKSLKGRDPEMIDAFRSHCRQNYAGEYELLFGVSDLEDSAIQAVQHLQIEFPDHAIRLIECPLRLGPNGKVSNLIQLVPHALYPYLLINDSDITVNPRYLQRVMAHFAPATQVTVQTEAKADSAANREDAPGQSAAKPNAPVGMVTTLYRGHSHGSLGSHLEALGIATDFQAGVLLSRMLSGGLRYGLGSTLAVSREALDKIGGLEPLVDYLADDHELGARIFRAGYRVALAGEVVETSIPAYNWHGFVDHQVRWARTVRDASPSGYVGLVFTHGFAWALLNVVASGISPLSLWLLALSFFLRIALAMMVGAEVLTDHYVLPRLWLLPFRDLVFMGIWIAGFAGNTIVWRNERFQLRNGKLTNISETAS
jgi:ceramide glucosyltransferase